MNQNKSSNRFFNISLAIVLAATLATASVMVGCSNNGEDTKETMVVTETQIVTRVVNGVFTDEDGNPLTDENGETVTAPTDSAESKTETKAESKTENSNSENSSKSSSSKTESSSKADSSSKAESSSGKTNSNSDSKYSTGKTKGTNNGYGNNKSGSTNSNTLTIEGESYSVGDTVICTYYLQNSKSLLNFQGYINYDGNCLKAVNAEMMGPASSGSIVNYELDQEIRFNGVKLGGYDYYDGGEFLAVEYQVVGGGTTSPSFTWEVVTGTDQKTYISNGVGTNGLSLTCTYSKG